MKKLAVLLVAAVGLLVASPALAWTWPVDGDVVRAYALGDDPYAAGQHRGIDIAATAGALVRAPAAGTVTFAGFVPSGGRTLTIASNDGYAVTLQQLAEISVAKGQAIAEDEVVATVGESVDSTTPTAHVHLGVRTAAERHGYVDPLSLLPPRRQAPPAAPAPAAPDPDEPPTPVVREAAVEPHEQVALVEPSPAAISTETLVDAPPPGTVLPSPASEPIPGPEVVTTRPTAGPPEASPRPDELPEPVEQQAPVVPAVSMGATADPEPPARPQSDTPSANEIQAAEERPGALTEDAARGEHAEVTSGGDLPIVSSPEAEREPTGGAVTVAPAETPTPHAPEGQLNPGVPAPTMALEPAAPTGAPEPAPTGGAEVEATAPSARSQPTAPIQSDPVRDVSASVRVSAERPGRQKPDPSEVVPAATAAADLPRPQLNVPSSGALPAVGSRPAEPARPEPAGGDAPRQPNVETPAAVAIAPPAEPGAHGTAPRPADAQEPAGSSGGATLAGLFLIALGLAGFASTLWWVRLGRARACAPVVPAVDRSRWPTVPPRPRLRCAVRGRPHARHVGQPARTAPARHRSVRRSARPALAPGLARR